MSTPEKGMSNARAGPGGAAFDAAATVERLAASCQEAVSRLGRRGAVVAVSGGVDSGVTAALCARGLGPERVMCLRLPERDTHEGSTDLGLELAQSLGTATEEESITAALEALGSYRRADRAIKKVVPDYEPGWPYKLVRSAPTGGIIIFSIVVETPDGVRIQRRMPPDPYRELLAASNMKQRVRKLYEYTWADQLGYAVAGTPNLLEYDQGFFVKGGDGLADFKPIARLYKTEVFALAHELGIPRRDRYAGANDRYIQPRAESGGVLLRLSARRNGHAAVGSRTEDEAGGAGSDGGAHGRRRGDRIRRDRPPANGYRVPACTRGAARSRRLMCGLAGIVRPAPSVPVSEEALMRMARALRHRGPDGYGLLLDEGAGLVSSRLAIFDLPRGWQPLVSPAGGSALVYNGEVYNHPELRGELRGDGESFQTTSDTEVVHRLLERDGLACLDRLNGQFAFAWWEPRDRRVTLVRDRFGVRPLHYALLPDGTLAFGSESKALFASGEVAADVDLDGIDDVFTLWGVRPPQSAFAGVQQVPAGGVVVWERGQIVAERRWWTPSYGEDDRRARGPRRPPAGKRAASPPSRCARRDISLRRARLEPPDGARPG